MNTKSRAIVSLYKKKEALESKIDDIDTLLQTKKISQTDKEEFNNIIEEINVIIGTLDTVIDTIGDIK